MRKFDYYDTVLVPWYSEDDFPALLDMVGKDPRIPRSYPEWKRQFAAATELLLAKGKTVQIITVRLAEYLEWLQITHRSNTVAARLRYLKWLATQNGQRATVLPVPARVLSDAGGEG